MFRNGRTHIKINRRSTSLASFTTATDILPVGRVLKIHLPSGAIVVTKYVRWIKKHRKTAACSALLLLFLALNGVAFMHAHAMTHFVIGGIRTPKPEKLSAIGKVKVLTAFHGKESILGDGPPIVPVRALARLLDQAFQAEPADLGGQRSAGPDDSLRQGQLQPAKLFDQLTEPPAAVNRQRLLFSRHRKILSGSVLSFGRVF